MDSVFPDMIARPKWRVAVRNLRPGDLGHVKYSKAVGHHEWRIAMVTAAKADEDGVVRTVTVGFRPRNKRDTGKPYVSKTAQQLEIGVQRFAVLMAAEEVQEMKGEEIVHPRPGRPSSVRNDVKLGGLGHATLGRRIVLPCGSPSPPLLHEDKLSGPGSGGPDSRSAPSGG